MNEELSGRALEVAVAKALGMEIWSIPAQPLSDGRMVYGVGFPGELCPGMRTFDGDRVWEHCAPKFLSNSNRFATVLDAICTLGIEWSLSTNEGTYEMEMTGAPGHYGTFRTSKNSYQEAVCRAFVAWKEQS